MGGPACFKLGAQHKKLRTDIESKNNVVSRLNLNSDFLVPSAPSFSEAGPPAQKQIVSEIESEQRLVAANRELIERFEQKIATTLARIWGD